MKRIIINSTLFIALIFAASCRRDNLPCINGKGSITTVTRTISDFKSVEFQTEGTVYISQGSNFEVKIEAQQNIIDDMQTELNGTELKIYNRHCIRNHDQIKVYITMPSLERVDLSGSGAIIVQSKFESDNMYVNVSGSGDIEIQDSIIANDVTVHISGSGNIKLLAYCTSFEGKISGSGNITASGSATNELLSVSGSGDLHLFDLLSSVSDVSISGSGNTEINVADNLDVSVSGSGDVYYKGNPTITSHNSGSGNLIHVN